MLREAWDGIRAPHYQAPGTRDPVEVPIGLEYSPPACEETWDPRRKEDCLEGTKFLLELQGGLRYIASPKKAQICQRKSPKQAQEFLGTAGFLAAPPPIPPD